MAVGGLTISAARASVVDFTFPHWEEPSAMLVKAHYIDWNYFLEVFHWQVWLLVMLTPIVVCLALFGAKLHCSGWNWLGNWDQFGDILLTCYGNMAAQGNPEKASVVLFQKASENINAFFFFEG